MYKFVSRVNEIKKVLTHFKLIETALDSIIILLICFIAFSYIGIKPGWKLFILPFIYSIVILKFRFSYDVTKIIEELYPSLRERLSTVYDNREQKNVVIEDLASTVLKDIEQVRYSSFLATRRLGIRVATILILVTLVLLTSNFSIYMNDQKNIFLNDRTDKTDINRISSGSDIDILNEPSYVKIKGEKEGLIVYRGSGYELNIHGEGKQLSERSRMFPEEGSSSDIYTEAIPVIYQEIVKNYFTNISVSK